MCLINWLTFKILHVSDPLVDIKTLHVSDPLVDIKTLHVSDQLVDIEDTTCVRSIG